MSKVEFSSTLSTLPQRDKNPFRPPSFNAGYRVQSFTGTDVVAPAEAVNIRVDTHAHAHIEGNAGNVVRDSGLVATNSNAVIHEEDYSSDSDSEAMAMAKSINAITPMTPMSPSLAPNCNASRSVQLEVEHANIRHAAKDEEVIGNDIDTHGNGKAKDEKAEKYIDVDELALSRQGTRGAMSPINDGLFASSVGSAVMAEQMVLDDIVGAMHDADDDFVDVEHVHAAHEHADDENLDMDDLMEDEQGVRTKGGDIDVEDHIVEEATEGQGMMMDDIIDEMTDEGTTDDDDDDLEALGLMVTPQ